jgi:hypothetical protein
MRRRLGIKGRERGQFSIWDLRFSIGTSSKISNRMGREYFLAIAIAFCCDLTYHGIIEIRVPIYINLNEYHKLQYRTKNINYQEFGKR